MTDQIAAEADHSVEHAASVIEGLLGAEKSPEQPQSQTQEATQTQAAEEPTEAVAAEAETTTETPEPQTLEEIAERLGIDASKLHNVKLKAKVGDSENEVTLREALDGYQRESDYTKKTMEFAEVRKAFEAEREKQTTEIKQRLIEAQALSQDLEQSLMSEHNSIDWTALRTTDPAEFAAKKQEFNERWNLIQAKKMRAMAESQRFQQEQQEKVQKFVNAERAKWKEVVPEWKDPAKFEADKNEIVTYLRGQGIPDTDIAALYDSRQIKIIRNAMLYEKSSKAATIAQKKVALLPKVLKPGTQTTKSDSRTEKDKELSTRLRKSGRLEDAAALIESRMK
jgi:hypothetical protein